MGAQIAAHFANVGIKTLLLDLASPGKDQDAVARGAVERLSLIKPPPLYSAEKAGLIQVGNFQDDLAKLSDCDWIIEAVVEKLKVKQDLWEQVESYRKIGAIVSTNTSGLSVAGIAKGRSEDFQRHWLGTHFFNPPRYMKLLELVPGPKTLPEVVDTVAVVGDLLLGKGIVIAKDTPNFIANRIGIFTCLRAVELMQELGLTIEEVDELTGPAVGRPRTGTFRLGDLIGVDVLVDVSENLHQSLPKDPWRRTFRPAPFLKEMVSRGWNGRKAGQGFYQVVDSSEGRNLLVLDPNNLSYRQRKKPRITSLERARDQADVGQRVRALLEARDESGAFLWPFVRDTLVYAASCVPEISDDYLQIDRAMRWGYNWELGPFELWQALGTQEVARRAKEDGKRFPPWVGQLLQQPPENFYAHGIDHELFFDIGTKQYQISPEEPQKICLDILKRRQRVVRSNPGASLIDLGDGVACLEFHSKMNAIGADAVQLARWTMEEVSRNFLALVIGNQGKDFSVGANLMLLLLEAQEGNWEEIDSMIRAFQDINLSFRYSPKPVVSAPFQRVLGGGAELCLACDAIVAGAETYMGLVEVGVGLIPAGGGSKEMLVRHAGECAEGKEPGLLRRVRQAFETIGLAKISRSAEEALSLKFLRGTDLIEVHPDRLLARAKRKALGLVEDGYVPPEPKLAIPVVGGAGLAALKVGIHLMRRAGYISEYDVLVGNRLAYVLTGGDINHPTVVSEQYLLGLEREAFLSLCGQRRTQERMQHTLKTGKPLCN